MGAVIGVAGLSQTQRRHLANNSQLPPEMFEKAAAEKPSMRGMVLDILYDPQDNDKVSKIVVLMMAKVPRDRIIPNGDKNLMISQKYDKKAMGVDPDFNWRLSYYPIAIEPAKGYMGTDADDKVIFYGAATEQSYSSIAQYVQLLEDKGIFESYGYLTAAEKRRLTGTRNNMDKVDGSIEARVGVRGNTTDAAALARTERERIAQENAERKAQARAAEKARKQEQDSTPSGKLAGKMSLHFNEKSFNPDIELEQAHNFAFLNDDRFIVLEELGNKMGFTSLRAAYDAVNGKHSEVLVELTAMGACEEDNAIDYAAALEKDLKDGLKNFFQRSKNRKDNVLYAAIVPFVKPGSDPTPETP